MKPAEATPVEAARTRIRAADVLDLAKARITVMVGATTAVGFVLGSGSSIDASRLVHTLGGTLLVSSAAGALNHVVERRLDARMARTRSRPIPAGRVSPEPVAIASLAAAAAGLAWLALGVNLLTAALGAICLLVYVAVYTPLKTRTTANTLVGAIAGAIPPVMGWTAATGAISAPALVLFGVLFLWQLPHFFAIASMYRDDYAQAGFRMTPVLDATGRRTAVETIVSTCLLIAIAALAAPVGLAGNVYLAGSFVLGALLLAAAIRMAQTRRLGDARRCLLVSVLYLPLLLALLVADRVTT